MKTKIITAALALALMGGTASVAQAQGYGPRYDNNRFDRDYRVDRDRDGYRDGSRFDRRDDRFGTNWRRGMTFRDHRRLMVRDWNSFGLRYPGRGLHWVRAGNAFLLVTPRGRVVDVVYRPNRRWGRY